MLKHKRFAIIMLVWACMVPVATRADDRILVDAGWTLSAGAIGPVAAASWRADGMAALGLDVAIPAFRFRAAREADPGAVAPILFDSNYIRISADIGISSDIVRVSGAVELEPVAFAHIKLAGEVGSGWDVGLSRLAELPGLGGLAAMGTLHGLALNPADSARPIQPIPFGGLVWALSASLPLNLSLHYFILDHMAMLMVELEPRVEYRSLSVAGAGQAWVWHSDGGMNLNGFRFSSSGFMGWKSSNAEGLREIGAFAFAETWLGSVRAASTVAAGGWGSDAWTGRFGLRGGYSPDAWRRVDLEVWMNADRNWTEATGTLRYFGDRVYLNTATGFGGLKLAYTRLF